MKQSTTLFLLLLIGLSISASIVVVMEKSIPFNIESKKMPSGTDFSQLVPLKVGNYQRVEYTPPQPGLDGEALYRYGKKEIFMLFSLSKDRKDLGETMQTIYTEIKENKTKEARVVSLKSDPAYIFFAGPRIAFFAWTRGLYCFSADSKGGDKKNLDEFMAAFPY
jgi:hypothetical protein